MKQSPQIQSRINTIAKELVNGKERGELLVKYGKKWSISKSAFDRLLKTAKPEAERLSILKDKAVSGAIISVAEEAARNGLKSVLEVDARLQEVIFNNHKLIRDGGRVIKVENTTADQLKAMDIYYKRNGHYTPIKYSETDNEGNERQNMSDLQFKVFMKEMIDQVK